MPKFETAIDAIEYLKKTVETGDSVIVKVDPIKVLGFGLEEFQSGMKAVEAAIITANEAVDDFNREFEKIAQLDMEIAVNIREGKS